MLVKQLLKREWHCCWGPQSSNPLHLGFPDSGSLTVSGGSLMFAGVGTCLQVSLAGNKYFVF
jgi:hypothetical protein